MLLLKPGLFLLIRQLLLKVFAAELQDTNAAKDGSYFFGRLWQSYSARVQSFKPADIFKTGGLYSIRRLL